MAVDRPGETRRKLHSPEGIPAVKRPREDESDGDGAGETADSSEQWSTDVDSQGNLIGGGGDESLVSLFSGQERETIVGALMGVDLTEV